MEKTEPNTTEIKDPRSFNIDDPGDSGNPCPLKSKRARGKRSGGRLSPPNMPLREALQSVLSIAMDSSQILKGVSLGKLRYLLLAVPWQSDSKIKRIRFDRGPGFFRRIFAGRRT